MPFENQIPLGTQDYPWPTMIRRDEEVNGQIVPVLELGVIQSNEKHLTLPSSRSFAEVMGIMMRGLPTRSMLPAIEFLIARMDPRQNNRVGNITSNPGLGKSFLAIMLGFARDPRGPIITDAGGRNLEYLLYQNVFDTEKNRVLTDVIDRKLASGQISPLSLRELRKFGRNFSENGSRFSVDWQSLGAAGGYEGIYVEDDKEPDSDTRKRIMDAHVAQMQIEYPNMLRAEIEKDTDWDDLIKLARRKPLDEAEVRRIVSAVRMYEGLEDQGGGIGFKVVKGPLVLAHEQGRDLVIDELNKCKKGSETPLQIVWQVLNGETAEHTVSLGGLGSFTFRRGQPGVVICTGNLPKDGVATHLISESFDRRVPSYRIPDFTAEDWMDRTAQTITSLSIPLISRTVAGEWQDVDKSDASRGKEWVVKDPEDFTKLLYEVSTLGMNENQRRNAKEWQLSQIGNWRHVMEFAKGAGEFYHKWSQLVDPESELLKHPSFGQIATEVTNDDNPTEKVTPSTMIRHVEQALVIGPDKKPAEETTGFSKSRTWDLPVVSKTSTPEPLEGHFGTRWLQAVMDEVYRSSIMVGKPELYHQLMIDAQDLPRLAELLNIDQTKIIGSEAQAKSVQDTHVALLRQLYPTMQLSDIDEDVLPIRLVQAGLKNGGISDVADTPSAKNLRILNTDLATVQRELMKPATAVNIAKDEDVSEAKKRLPANELLSLPALLSSLALPVFGEQNLNALWNEDFTQGHFLPDDATAISENRSDDGLAMTTLMCRTEDDAYQTLHVFKNGVTGRTVIVGDEAISNDLYNRLKHNKIVYVPRTHATTAQRLSDEIQGIGIKRQVEVEKAFLMRNSRVTQKAPDFVQMMTDPSAYPTFAPIFLSQKPLQDVAISPVQPLPSVRSLLNGLGLK